MADKTLHEFAAPSTDNVAIGPQINMGDVDFDLKSNLITMAQASPFYGKPNEDACWHRPLLVCQRGFGYSSMMHPNVEITRTGFRAVTTCRLPLTNPWDTQQTKFLEICSTYTIKGVSPDAVRLRLFPFFLLGRAKQRFYANHAAVNTWDKCSTAFLSKFFPMGKTNALRGRISSFQQTRDKSIPDAWERLQEYVATCPHHGMDDWLIL
uniref:Transposable element protein, putative, Retrotrans_gag n=1 Tax=Oryza sativa subsp. japonica TaxID=39947 RepID=Q2QTG3_ORYSJ|nr:Transposable element protein, putative, Retrotrans_gag [Oryza sativa Japonica Group]